MNKAEATQSWRGRDRHNSKSSPVETATKADLVIPAAAALHHSDLTSVVGDVTGLGGTIASGATSVFGDATSAVVGFGETLTSVFPSVYT